MEQLSQDKDGPQHLLAALSLPAHEQRVAALSALHMEASCRDAVAALLEKLQRFDALERNFSEVLQREKLEAMRELAYGASHEINNPLANISTRAQTLLRDETDPERRRKLATINSQAFRAYEMIADMMLFAKPPDLIRKSVDLAKLIPEVVSELADQAETQGSRLVVGGLEQGCVLSADADQIAVALKALVRNSLEALEMGGQVKVDLQRSPVPAAEEAVIRVADTGPGIPPAVRRHMFDPFYSGREAGRGLGFGLSKCWRIVTLHGGSIDADTSDGQGARFTIRLPVAARPAPTPVLAHG